MTYQLKRFNFAEGQQGYGNYFADRINQFLAVNPTISPVGLSINWRFGRSRSDSFYLSFLYRGGGGPSRAWCVQFQSSPNYTAEARATAFFANNPTYLPLMSVVVARPSSVTTSRRLLVIYATQSMSQVVCVAQNNAGAPVGAVAMGAYGTMYDPLNTSRPGLPALNLGNTAWPAGGVNMLIRTNENSPDVCAAAGIAPACFAGATFTAPPALSIDSLCGHCLPPELITVTTTSTTTTSTSSTSTSSTSSTTSTTSTTSSTTSTTSTTTTTTSTTTTTTTTTSSSSTTTVACASWSNFSGGTGNGSAVFTLPVNACAGDISCNVSNPSQGAAKGVIFSVSTNLGFVGASACLTLGSAGFSIPAGVTTVTVTVTQGCNDPAGPDQTWTVSGNG